jgi:hypothetical protein
VREEHERQDLPREHSLDELAKGLASGTLSRGRALKLMGGALLGGVLASVPGLAGAAPSTVRGGKGPCSEGRTNCRGQCVDLSTNTNNCGQCANVCSTGEDCLNGTCVDPNPPPPPPPTCSSGDCSECAPGYICVELTEDSGQGLFVCTDQSTFGSGKVCTSGVDCGNGLCAKASCGSSQNVCVSFDF